MQKCKANNLTEEQKKINVNSDSGNDKHRKSTDGGSSYSVFRYGCRVNSPNNYVSATTSGLIALNANDRVLLEREDGIVHINNPFNFFSMFLIG